MPTPIIEILDTFLSKISFLKFMLLFSLIIFLVLARSSLLIVNVKSVSFPFADMFCTTISTLMEFLDKGLKIAAAIPGLSLTPTRVTFASF